MKPKHPGPSQRQRRATLPAMPPDARVRGETEVPPSAPGQRPRSRPVLFALSGPRQGAVFPLHGSQIRLGRGSDVEINLDDDAVSSHHAHISHRRDGFYLDDDGSRNGSQLNGTPVHEPVRLLDGDQLRFGNTILRFWMLDDLEERALSNLFELTVRDPLTRAYNRRFMVQHLHSELAFAARQHHSLALLLVDIDHFKQVNDSHGHAVGDTVLQMVASSIQRLLRPYDVLCRYGGEEFVVVARDTSLRNAEILGERIRRHVQDLRFQVKGSSSSVTVSVGVASLEPQLPDGSEATMLLDAVDRAMYAAKESGRNRVCASHLPSPGRHPSPTRMQRTSPPQAGDMSAAGPNDASDFRPPSVPRFN